MLSKLKAIIVLLRPPDLLLAAIGCFIGALIASDSVREYLKEIVFADLAAVLGSGAATSINDYYDVDIDRINRPHRPLVSGEVRRSEALLLTFTMVVLGLALSYMINIFCFAVAVMSAILLFLYSFKFKRVILLGNLTVAYLMSMAILFGGIAVENVGILIPLGIAAFLVGLSREIMKDIEDVRGDLERGIRTLPIVYGERGSRIFSAILLILFIVVLFKSHSYLPFGREFLFFLGLLSLPLIYVLYLLLTNGRIFLISRITKIVMFLILMLFLFERLIF
ncbi:MAG: geranylgeranylglycerol-phosphate geranylgeranyltransferase [Candidatus Methanofastidiosia archaeon]